MLRFLDVPQDLVPTSEGNVGVPILYRKARSVLAMFPTDPEALVAALPESGLQPVPLAQGKPVVLVAFFEYFDTTIGPYHEAAVATFAVPKELGLPRRPAFDLLLPLRWRHVGLYILHLPVTTRIAWAAGRELWGLPKFVTEIPIDWRENRFHGAVLAPNSDAPLCSLEGELGTGTSLPQRGVLLYSQLNGEWIVTHVPLSGLARHIRNGAMRLEVGPDSHPMARTLRDLGLNGATASFVQVAPSYQARLHLGRRLATAVGQPIQAASTSEQSRSVASHR